MRASPRKMVEFVFPSKPEQLLEPDCESGLSVVTEVNVAEMGPEETEHLGEGATLLLSSARSRAGVSVALLPPPPLRSSLQEPLRTCCCDAELCYDICEHDPLCVGEQQFFDRVFGLIRSAVEVTHRLSARPPSSYHPGL